MKMLGATRRGVILMSVFKELGAVGDPLDVGVKVGGAVHRRMRRGGRRLLRL